MPEHDSIRPEVAVRITKEGAGRERVDLVDRETGKVMRSEAGQAGLNAHRRAARMQAEYLARRTGHRPR